MEQKRPKCGESVSTLARMFLPLKMRASDSHTATRKTEPSEYLSVGRRVSRCHFSVTLGHILECPTHMCREWTIIGNAVLKREFVARIASFCRDATIMFNQRVDVVFQLRAILLGMMQLIGIRIWRLVEHAEMALLYCYPNAEHVARDTQQFCSVVA